jgi:ribonuclease HI
MGQALADFLVEFCNIREAEELPKELTWVVYVDGSSARGRSGVGVLLRNPEGQEFGFAIKLDFVTTNNEAEYEAVIAGLALSREMGVANVEIRSDSQVVVGQVQGQFEAQEDRMARYLEQVRQFQSYFERVVITKIPQDENIRADEFSKIASGTDEEIEASRRQIIVLTEPSITPKVNVMEADTTPNEPEWATKTNQFLRNGLLPEDKVAARKVKIQATRFCLLGEVLYKRGYSKPLLKCLSKTEVDYVLKEIHEGVCGNHSGGRMLAQKTIRAGYYWPTISRDSALLVKHCDKCQRFSRIMKTSPEKLTPFTSTWPFAKWGVDIVGPMPVGKGSRKFLVVAVDYFTKWAEAEALATITITNITSFLWKSVVFRFGIPHAFVTVNHFGSGVQNFVSETIIARYFIQRRTGR